MFPCSLRSSSALSRCMFVILCMQHHANPCQSLLLAGRSSSARSCDRPNHADVRHQRRRQSPWRLQHHPHRAFLTTMRIAAAIAVTVCHQVRIENAELRSAYREAVAPVTATPNRFTLPYVHPAFCLSLRRRIFTSDIDMAAAQSPTRCRMKRCFSAPLPQTQSTQLQTGAS